MNENPTLKNFTDNSEWSLVSYKPIRFEVKYVHWFDDNSFSEIKYKILMKRKSLFVLQNYAVPAIILCTLTLVSFFIPFAQGKPFSLKCSIEPVIYKNVSLKFNFFYCLQNY